MLIHEFEKIVHTYDWIDEIYHDPDDTLKSANQVLYNSSRNKMINFVRKNPDLKYELENKISYLKIQISTQNSKEKSEIESQTKDLKAQEEKANLQIESYYYLIDKKSTCKFFSIIGLIITGVALLFLAVLGILLLISGYSHNLSENHGEVYIFLRFVFAPLGFLAICFLIATFKAQSLRLLIPTAAFAVSSGIIYMVCELKFKIPVFNIPSWLFILAYVLIGLFIALSLFFFIKSKIWGKKHYTATSPYYDEIAEVRSSIRSIEESIRHKYDTTYLEIELKRYDKLLDRFHLFS